MLTCISNSRDQRPYEHIRYTCLLEQLGDDPCETVVERDVVASFRLLTMLEGLSRRDPAVVIGLILPWEMVDTAEMQLDSVPLSGHSIVVFIREL